MEVLEHRIVYKSRKDEYHIYPFGDLHCGIKHCAEKMVRAQVKVIQNDPLARWFGVGDYGEFISPQDPRWDVAVIADWVKKDNIAMSQVDWICDLFTPIKDKCIGLLEGNHEDSIRIHSNVDVQYEICKRLGVPNLGYSCFIRLLFSRQRVTEGTYTVICFFTHGSGWAITKGTKLNKLQRVMDAFEADIYAMGHMHDIITDSKPYLTLNVKNEIKQKEKIGAVTGSWFKTYQQGVRASYGEKRTYSPTALGCPIFIIVPDKQKIKIEG